MITRIPTDPALRSRRKADLLLASQLLRGQAALAVDDLGGRADGWVLRVRAWRKVLSHPIVLTAAGGAATFFATAGKGRRGRLWRGMRWAWLAWRLWGGRKR
ncbi:MULTISPECIES: hypothetical protein [unclassified Roseateles]|uniref:hypothetical protein n=1 Tax=unclassified Roseateles TaxID=2626991 RepID=UPI0006FE3B76|nr:MULTISPECIES: hypothetical protein [unclassified Roseateles]KQW45416.1 hypothetical protein ASC81_10890 [Pelomonas sp. Root405]KRA72260.1 hypothetical protein ASD88_10890 [Pelomonas sp. Root662]